MKAEHIMIVTRIPVYFLLIPIFIEGATTQ